MSRAPTFAEYVAALADELGIRLEPWHTRALADLEAGRDVVLHLETGRRTHRRWRLAAIAAAAALGGTPLPAPDLLAPPEVLADRYLLNADAAQLLELYSRKCGVDVGLATEAVRRIVR